MSECMYIVHTYTHERNMHTTRMHGMYICKYIRTHAHTHTLHVGHSCSRVIKGICCILHEGHVTVLDKFRQ